MKTKQSMGWKKLCALGMGMILLLSCAAASADMLSDIQAKGEIVIGMSVDFPPYEFYGTDPATGKEVPMGFDVKLAEGIGEALGVKIKLADQSFAGLITALSAGEIDMIVSGLAIKPERMEVVDFTIPYYSGVQLLLVPADKADAYQVTADLDGKTVAAQLGSLQAEILEKQFKNATPYMINSPAILALDLVQGNVDAWIITELVAKQYMAVYPGKLAMSPVPVEYESHGGSAVAVAKGDNAALLEKVNAYITQVKEDGTLDKWVEEACLQSVDLLEKPEDAATP